MKYLVIAIFGLFIFMAGFVLGWSASSDAWRAWCGHAGSVCLSQGFLPPR